MGESPSERSKARNFSRCILRKELRVPKDPDLRSKDVVQVPGVRPPQTHLCTQMCTRVTWAPWQLRGHTEWEHLDGEPLTQSQIAQSSSGWASTHQFQVQSDHPPQGGMLQAPQGQSALALADRHLPQRETQTQIQAQALVGSEIHMGQPIHACSQIPALAPPPLSWQDAGARGITGEGVAITRQQARRNRHPLRICGNAIASAENPLA